MTKIQDLINDRRRWHEELYAAQLRFQDHKDLRRYYADREKVRPPLTVNGVSVKIVQPENRTVYRRRHERVVFYVDGRVVKEDAARQRVEG